MIVQYDKSFEKSLKSINSQIILHRLKLIIIQIENTSQLAQIPNIKKLTGFKVYYRLRISDYRIGLEAIDNTTIRFIVIAHRKDIYKIFP